MTVRSLAAIVGLCALGAPVPVAARQAAAPPPQARPADVASEDAILTALYEVISGPAGERRDWDRFRSLFAPGARLIPTQRAQSGGVVRVRVLTPEEYATQIGPRLEEMGFFEREIARTSETFGAVTHAFSTYESRRTADEPEPSLGRGINSIQLLNDGTRWWVVSIFWDSERPDNPIPARYLSGR